MAAAGHAGGPCPGAARRCCATPSSPSRRSRRSTSPHSRLCVLRLRGWISRSRRDRRERRSGADSRPGARLTHSGLSSSTSPVDERRDHVRGAEKPGADPARVRRLRVSVLLRRRRPRRIPSRALRHAQADLAASSGSELHPGSDVAAELSELAAASGKFWEANSQLLTGRESFAHDDLIPVGSKARSGPGRGRVGDPRPDLPRSRPRGRRRRHEGGRSGGPTFFVGGERLVGHWRQLAQLVPAALREQS